MKHEKPRHIAIVREVSDSYNNCALEFNSREPIDVELAKVQHREYVRALEESGVEVVKLPAKNQFPDACFVEDAAVVIDDVAIITHMGTESRNGEQEEVARCLSHWMQVVYMQPPACLEGGDVLKIEKTLYVGESRRTNKEGIAFLEAIARPKGYEVITLPVQRVLHLKTGMTWVGKSTVVAAASVATGAKRYLKNLSVFRLSEESAYAANILKIDGTVLIPSGFPSVTSRIKRIGSEVKELQMSEFKKGEAGLTCLSIILDRFRSQS